MSRLVLILAVGFASMGTYAQSNVNASEYEVKAAFLYNFAKFVEWPATAFQDSTAPFIIGIVGTNPFGGILDQVVGSKTVRGRELQIIYINSGRSLPFCHLLFISNSEQWDVARILEKVRGTSTLTVGEMDRFTDNRGIIQFVMKDNRIHFIINIESAEEAGLKLSSKLLNLAINVKKKSGNGE